MLHWIEMIGSIPVLGAYGETAYSCASPSVSLGFVSENGHAGTRACGFAYPTVVPSVFPAGVGTLLRTRKRVPIPHGWCATWAAWQRSCPTLSSHRTSRSGDLAGLNRCESAAFEQ